MKTTITIENFEAMKYKLLLCVSKYGNILHPEKWSDNLSIYDFDSIETEDMVFNYLFDEHRTQLAKAISKFKK